MVLNKMDLLSEIAQSLAIDPERLNRIGNGHGNAFELLPYEIREILPGLGKQEKMKDSLGRHNPLVFLKLFHPASPWTWYVTEGEYDEDHFMFFGFVVGMENEWGYFGLQEIAQDFSYKGIKVERDLYFRPTPLRDISELEGVVL